MAGELILRYWPVDGDYSEAQYQSFNGGVAVELQATQAPWYGYDYGKPTMAVVGHSGSLDGDVMGPEVPDVYGAHAYAASVYYLSTSGLVEGQYAEASVALLTQTGNVFPVFADTLPLKVYLTGFGPYPRSTYEGPPIWTDGGPFGSAALGYSGGALQVGIYDEGGEFVELGCVWIDGYFFQEKYNGESWANPALPKWRDNAYLDSLGALAVDLAANTPVTAFWTQKAKSRETVG